MKLLRALSVCLLTALALSSCNAPLRRCALPSDSAVAAREEAVGNALDVSAQEETTGEPFWEETAEPEVTAEETTGVAEIAEKDTDAIPPLKIDPPAKKKPLPMIPQPTGTTAHYITDAPEPQTTPEETEETEVPEEPEEPEVKYPVVLMYHCVSEEPTTENTSLFVRPSDFESQARAIAQNGIDTLFADEFGEVENVSVILTFDDGYEDNYTEMFPILKKYGLKATVYMIAYKIGMPGYLTAEQIREMSDSGLVQFGSHTLDHPELSRLSAADIRAQLEGSKWIISQVTGKPVTTLAYPSGRYNEEVMDIASEMYEFAYTTDDDPYYGQDPMAMPRYAVLRGETGKSFLRFIYK